MMGQFLLDHHESRQEVLRQLDDVQLQVKLDGMDLSNLDYAQPQVPTAEGKTIS